MKDQVLEHIWQVRRSISEQNDFDSKKLVTYYKKRATRKMYPASGSSGGQKVEQIAELSNTYDTIH
ncbi:MAG: hypothetical protein WCP12_18060 [bacterium]